MCCTHYAVLVSPGVPDAILLFILVASVHCGDSVCDFNAFCQGDACVCFEGYEGVGFVSNGRPGCHGMIV